MNKQTHTQYITVVHASNGTIICIEVTPTTQSKGKIGGMSSCRDLSARA